MVGGSLALGLASAPPAAAHLGHIVVSAERYLKIDATEADTRVVVSLTLGETEGRRVLSAADGDHDGEVSQREADAYLDEWARGLRDELAIEVDGERVEAPFREPFFDPIGPVASVPVTVEMVAHVPVSQREATISLHDAMVGRQTFDRTEVAFRAHDGAEVVACGAGDAPDARITDLAFGRSTGLPMPDVVSLRALYPGRAEGSFAWVWLIPVALLALTAAAWRSRRR